MRVVLAFLLVLVSFGAVAHKATSGFTYPPVCCRGSAEGGDCMPISGDDVISNPDGTYTIKASGEVFLQPVGLNEDSNKEASWNFIDGSPSGKGLHVNAHARWSPDLDFHRCFRTMSDPTDGTYCLLVPRPSI